MANTDEEFMASLENEFPGVDWDNLQPLESVQDVYIVTGVGSDGYHFSTVEMATREAAEASAAGFRNDPKYVADTISVKATKPSDEVWKRQYKAWRDEILAGKTVFPI